MFNNKTTLGDLKERALDYADLSGAGGVDDKRLRNYVNLGLSELHDILVSAPNSDYFRAEKTYSITTSKEEYALPDDFYKATQVYYTASNRRFVVDRWQPAEISGYRTTPVTSGDVEMWYVRQFRPLRTNKEVVDQILPNGWEDYVALTAAYRLLMREESDTRDIHYERQRQRERILHMMEPRDQGMPDSIGEVTGRWDNTRDYLNLQDRYFKYRIMGQNIYFLQVEYLGV